MSDTARSSSEQERKTDSSAFGAIKLVTFKQPTTDSTVVLKRVTDRQTDKIHIYRLTDSILSA
jgi:hypothetical protein